MDADPWVAGVAESLRAEGAAERAVFEKRYQKSELEHYGARVRAVRTVVK